MNTCQTSMKTSILLMYLDNPHPGYQRHENTIVVVQLTSSRVRLGQSFKTVGYGSASCWGDVGPEV